MRRFGQLEALVMEQLWSASGSLTVREVLSRLPDERNRAYTTVMTVLDNLFRKGLVTRAMEGKAYRYQPLRSREEHTAAVMEEVLSSGGDRGAALLHFVDHLDPAEAQRFRETLERSLGRGDDG